MKPELQQKIENCSEIAVLKQALLNVLDVCDARETVYRLEQRRARSVAVAIPKIWISTIREAVAEGIHGTHGRD